MDISTPSGAAAYVAEWELHGGAAMNVLRFYLTAKERADFARADETLFRAESAAREWELVNIFASAELRAAAQAEIDAAAYAEKKRVEKEEADAAMVARAKRRPVAR